MDLNGVGLWVFYAPFKKCKHFAFLPPNYCFTESYNVIMQGNQQTERGTGLERFKGVVVVSLVGMLVLFGIFIVGCSREEKEVKLGSDNNVTQSESNEDESGDQQNEEQVLSLRDMGKNKSFEVIAEKITTVDKLDSPDATALLQRGEAGESPENASSPSTGNEYLLVTLKLKNIDSKPHVVVPVDIKLENKSAKEYTEVVTNGFGGVFNMKPIEAGKEGSVSAVYEVPKGEKDLVFSYAPFGDGILKFNIR